MASEMLETTTVLLWRSKPEWWTKHRALILNGNLVPGVKAKTTIEEYHAILEKIRYQLTKDGIEVVDVQMSPAWVKRELQEYHLTLTARNVSAILSDPIGIERKGIKPAW